MLMNKLIPLVILVLCTSTTRSQELDMSDDMMVAVVACAATGAIIGSKTEGLAGSLIMNDAKWWKEVLATAYFDNDDDAALQIIEYAMKKVQDNYNSGKTSWDEIIAVSRQCSDAKIELETAVTE
jgi:adenine-specific DNA methylase